MDAKETSIERIKGEKYLTVYSNEKAIINKIKEFKESYPSEVTIVKEYEDGTVTAHFPISWFKFIKPPAKREYTDEQKQAMAERMAKAREARANNE